MNKSPKTGNSPNSVSPVSVSSVSGASVSASRIAAGIALTYTLYFLFFGLYLPYFPLWLKHTGLDGQEIAILLAVPLLLRVLASGQMVALADRHRDRASVLSAFFWASTLSFCVYLFADGFWALLAVTVFFNLFWNPALPVIDAITLSGVRRYSIDYGRVRIWGSLAFIVANLVGGYLLGAIAPNHLIFIMVALLFLLCLVSHAIPRIGRLNSSIDSQTGKLTTFAMIKMPHFMLVMAAAGLLQASHAFMYGFGSIYWESIGISGGVIGGLWAVGVAVEIILFQFSSRVLKKISTVNLMALAAIGGMIRWSMMTQGLGELGLGETAFFAAQMLHGLSFGATHIATMHFIKDAVPEENLSSAQGVGFVVGGIFMGLAVLASGTLYEELGRYGFAVMAAMCVLGLICLLIAKRFAPAQTSTPKPL